jgi:hypothetical protein
MHPKSQEKKGLSIDLSDHKNPEKFLEEIQTRFPDPNISLTLEGTTLWIKASEKLPSQVVASAYSILLDQARYAMYGPSSR